MTAEKIADLVVPLFQEGGLLHGRYNATESAFEPVPGGAVGWQSAIFPAGSAAPRILRVYPLARDGGDLVRAHWRNEVRALLRVSSTEHPSLPRFREGTYVEAHRLGFVIIDDVGVPVLGSHPVAEGLSQSPLAAFRRWFSLLEATMLVQDEGLIHRSVSPLAACALEDANASIVLDGFQMSAFVSTWLAGSATTDRSWRGELKGVVLACLSPERAGPLLGLPRKFAEGLRSDVFGLGMLGCLWFAPPVDGWAAAFDAESYTEEAHRTLVSDARRGLTASPIPHALQSLLRTMTEFEPANRIPGARVAYEEAAKLYGSILRALSEREESDAAPRQLFYLKETIERLYADNRANSAPQHPDYEEYNEYIARDLDGGTIVWAPEGFKPWDTSHADAKAGQARIVLLGREYAYFSQLLDHGGQQETDRAVVIKYLLPVHRARELRNSPRAAPVPSIKIAFFAIGPRARPVISSPSWGSIIQAVRVDAGQLIRPAIVRASHWLLGAHRALLAAREYRFERIQEEQGIVLREHMDPTAIELGTEEGAFLSLVKEHMAPPPMGVVFERVHLDAEGGDDTATFEFLEKRGDLASPIRLQFEKKLDDHTVRFRSDPGAMSRIPTEGYVRPVDAFRFVLQRQRRAVADLETRQRHLAAQLSAPTGVRLRDDGPIPSSEDETSVLVHQVRETWPFFAVQGPPGTGKTYVAARVIRDVLREDSFARILVSAQSHHAVDNLLSEVERTLPEGSDAILLRVATERTQKKVAAECQQHLADRLLERVRGDAKRAGERGTKEAPILSKRWRKVVSDYLVDADLAQRLTRAASVVFASCAGAGSPALEEKGVTFDWIVAEEAARGWLTEFLVPLVRGTRWLMLGDQAQLPAFGRNELDLLLKNDAEGGRTEAATGTPIDPRWRDSFLRHFAHAIETGRRGRVPTACTLTVQRRMHPHIGQLVGQAFYGGTLEHHACTERPHKVRVNGIDPSTAFVWVDTSSLGQVAWERGLINDLEVRLTGYLLTRGIEAVQHDKNISPLFVLSPYRAQVRAVGMYARQLDREVVRTVDSVQGRQAEIVLVSLVRNNAASDERAGIGFLAEPERVNVMFSRARRLLVIVGAFGHFERFGIAHWHEIAKYVRSDKRFLVDATDIGFRAGGPDGTR